MVIGEKKKKKTIECDKSTLTFEVGTAHCDNGIVESEKKNKGITKCGKSIVKNDIGIA